MTQFADLHIHTNYSDSTDSPQEVVAGAIENGLSCISISDHDTIEGVAPAVEAAKEFSLEVLAGIEFSAEIHGRDVHILGYLVDCTNTLLLEAIRKFQDVRVDRIIKMIEKLKEQGVDNITSDEVRKLTLTDSVGRPHLAALLFAKGWISNERQAYSKYIGEDCPCHVPKYKQTPFEAIDLIHQAGGVAVLAHPMVTNKDELIPEFVASGLDGLEVYYANCSDSIIHYYEGLAKKHNLVMTGGSDAHGKTKFNTHIGKARIPYELVEQLKERAKKYS